MSNMLLTCLLFYDDFKASVTRDNHLSSMASPKVELTNLEEKMKATRLQIGDDLIIMTLH